MTTLLREVADRAHVTREIRDYTVSDIECRTATDGKISFDGIASVVDTEYSVRDSLGEYSETIATGAWNRTIKGKADVRLLVNHAGVPLARTKSKTLGLSTDPHLRAQAPDLDRANPTVQEIQSALDRHDVDQMSVGMRVVTQKWNSDYTQRTITEAELFDVSIVTFPASTTTSATLRSVDELIQDLADVDLTEDELRRAIHALEALLPKEELPEVNPFELRDRDDLERLAHRRRQSITV